MDMDQGAHLSGALSLKMSSQINFFTPILSCLQWLTLAKTQMALNFTSQQCLAPGWIKNTQYSEE